MPVISIRPNTSILKVLSFIEYEPWFALAEFIDNSITSYQMNKSILKNQLTVEIELNNFDSSIRIKDDAAGIGESDYARAFRAAEIPPDTNRLSEFGMGMKVAACWFTDVWTVRSKAIDESIERTVKFDISQIASEHIEEIEVQERKVNHSAHYTIIELRNVKKFPKAQTQTKIKNHLASIYRVFLRENSVQIIFNGSPLKFEEPKILEAPRYDDPNGGNVFWKKEIDFPLEGKDRITGFVAIRETASTSEAGLALFRRGRLIEGSFDETFRPSEIFGASNSFKYQRVFGEIHLEGFDVVFTKKGILRDENFNLFLELLREDLSHPDFPLLTQAEKHRRKVSQNDAISVKKAIRSVYAPIKKEISSIINEVHRQVITTDGGFSIPNRESIEEEIVVQFNNFDYLIYIGCVNDNTMLDLYEVGNFRPERDIPDNVEVVGVRVSLNHPFMETFVNGNNESLRLVLRIFGALGLAEFLENYYYTGQGGIKRNFNEIIAKLMETTEYVAS